MVKAISLTLNEASYVVGQSSATINRAVDRGVIQAKRQRRGKAELRKLGPAELRYLAIAGEVEKDLTPAARRKVYQAVRRLPGDVHRVDLGVMEFRLTEIDERIAQRLQRLEQTRALVDDKGDGTPVLRGTNVPIHAVAALARSQSVAEIVEDYPGLTPDLVEGAVEYTKVYPKPGRPFPARSFKRMLGDLATAGAWDLDDPEQVSPRPIP